MKNLQKELDKILLKVDKGSHLLLHSCCAPCSSYVLEYLSDYFEITVFFYNPNILPQDEYSHRLSEQKRLIKKLKTKYPINIIESDYDSEVFLEAVKGLEDEPEGGERCTICYELRLKETAKKAKEKGADFFTTTLSISPHKDAKRLDDIASSLEDEYSVKHLPSDFKKKGGYQRSIQLSSEYSLYRQDFCGCPFSKAEQLKRQTEKLEKENQ